MENDYLLEIEDEVLEYLNQTPRWMIQHLHTCGGQLDFADTKKLIADCNREWDANKVPQVYFNRVEKATKQLKRSSIQSNLNKQRDMALYFLNASGEYNAAVREWETQCRQNMAQHQSIYLNRICKKTSKTNSTQNSSKQI